MTNELKWRLSELPTGDEVASLVEQKVITTKEARQILFNEGKDDSKKVKELSEEVKFLRELCDKLAAKSNGWTTIIREYQQYKPIYPTWYTGYSGVINTGATSGSLTTTSGTGAFTVTGVSGSKTANKLLSNLN